MDSNDSYAARKVAERWTPLYKWWTEKVMRRAAREVVHRAAERVEAAAILQLGPDEDKTARGLTLCQLGQIHLICVLRPSLTCTSIMLATQYMGASPQAVVTVRMPLHMWETWSKGAVDFCETMCEDIRGYVTGLDPCALGDKLTKPSVTDVVYHCEKAGANPGGSFFMTMQYNSEASPVPVPAHLADEAKTE